jgi:hypothetical protein
MTIYRERRIVGSVERHLQTAILVALLGLGAWGLKSISDTQKSVAEISAEVRQLQAQITRVEDRFGLYLPIREADARLETVDTRLRNLEDQQGDRR